MSRAFPTIQAVLAATMALAGIAAQAQDRTVYRCVNAAGVIVFSDQECMGNTAKVNIKSPSEEELAKRKAERDANNARDTALANQVQADRLAREQAGRAAQEQQMQVNRAQAEKLEQERNQRNSAVNSAPNVSQPVPFTGP